MSLSSQPQRLAGLLFCAWLSLYLISPAGSAAPRQPPAATWKLIYNQDEVRIWTRALEGSAIAEFQAQTTVHAPVEAILALLADPEACSRWIHQCSEARILEQRGFHWRRTWQVSDMPWPVEDRDLVLDVAVRELPGRAFELTLNNQPKAHEPTEKLRIQKARGSYLLRPLDPDTTHLTWIQHTDPGGNLPAWLVNQLLLDVPLQSLAGLRRETESPDSMYRQLKLRRDTEGHILGWTLVNPARSESGRGAAGMRLPTIFLEHLGNGQLPFRN